MLIPKRLEIGNWKLNVAKNQGSITKPKVTFDMLFDKYSKQKAVTSDRPVKKDEITSTSRETSIISQGSHRVQRCIISEARHYSRLGYSTSSYL
jgi:hypothetical protein